MFIVSLCRHATIWARSYEAGARSTDLHDDANKFSFIFLYYLATLTVFVLSTRAPKSSWTKDYIQDINPRKLQNIQVWETRYKVKSLMFGVWNTIFGECQIQNHCFILWQKIFFFMKLPDFKVNWLITNLNCCNNNQSEESHPENLAKKIVH
jgi:hypothetical protein